MTIHPIALIIIDPVKPIARADLPLSGGVCAQATQVEAWNRFKIRAFLLVFAWESATSWNQIQRIVRTEIVFWIRKDTFWDKMSSKRKLDDVESSSDSSDAEVYLTD